MTGGSRRWTPTSCAGATWRCSRIRDYYVSLARLRECLLGTRQAEAFMPLPRATAAGLGIFHRSDADPA
ncbi:MAG: hypothetical protein R3C32_12630 [Chloroflexota bacterium]